MRVPSKYVFFLLLPVCLISNLHAGTPFSWPEETRGLCLGSRVKAIRQRKLIIDDVYLPQLKEVDFVFNLKKHNQDMLVQAAELYVKQKQGAKVIVPSTYVCPVSPIWPSNLRGFTLGARLNYLKKTCRHNRDKEEGIAAGESLQGLICQLEKIGIMF